MIDNNTIQEIKTKLKNINNVAYILNTLFMPIEQLVEQKHYTTNEAINAKESAQKYIQKYGCFTLNTTVNSIIQLLNDETTRYTNNITK